MRLVGTNALLLLLSLLIASCSSAPETKLAALFHNGKDATLIDVGHPQPPAPMMAGSSTAIKSLAEHVSMAKQIWNLLQQWQQQAVRSHSFRACSPQEGPATSKMAKV